MSKFNEKYEIRLAKIADIPDIMNFIGLHWKSGHILSQDRVLFEYEYVYENQVNFVLAFDKEKSELEGIFGFLNASYPKNMDNKDIWGSIWKVKEGNLPLLGVELTKRVMTLTGCRMQIGNGANPRTTVPLRERIFKDHINKLSHYYLLNPSVDNFKVAKIKEKSSFSYEKEQMLDVALYVNIKEVKQSFDLDLLEEAKPYKDLWYINKRFFNHPYYQYEVFGVRSLEKEKSTAIFIAREIEVLGVKILRIVDFYGERELFGFLGAFFDKLFKEKKYEYIDFYTFGFESKYILNAGFTLKVGETNVIPNYFEPFIQSNVEIWVNYSDEGTLFFKADSDQDRPNMRKKEVE